MRRVSYKSVISKVASLFKGETTLSTEEEALANVFLNQVAGEFWEGTFWPEWTVSEERTFRARFSGSGTYVATDEVYDGRGDLYVQALRTPRVSNSVTNALATVATLTFASAHGLSVGDVVWVTVAGIDSTFNGTWLATAASTTTLTYTMASVPGGGPYATGTVTFHPTDSSGEVVNAYWAESWAGYSGDDWTEGTAYVVGDTVREVVSGSYYMCHTAHTATTTTLDVTKFGILTGFVRSIDFTQAWETTVIGDVKEVWNGDPETLEECERCELPFELLNGAVVVRGTANVVWVVFRLTVPSWTGDDYSSTATYGLGDQVYDDTTGDFYVSLQGANTGNAVTSAAWWERIDFPYDLRDCVALGVQGLMLSADGEDAKALVFTGMGAKSWKTSVDRYERQQGQAGQMRVKTR